MSDAREELYQQVILEHNKNPRNFKLIEACTHQAAGHNPLCGDRLSLTLKLEHEYITEIGFQGQGCAISKASSSMMTTAVKGKTIGEALALFEEFHRLVTGQLDLAKDPSTLGKLAVFSSIWKYPARVKCAALAWHTLKSALSGGKQVSTE